MKLIPSFLLLVSFNVMAECRIAIGDMWEPKDEFLNALLNEKAAGKITFYSQDPDEPNKLDMDLLIDAKMKVYPVKGNVKSSAALDMDGVFAPLLKAYKNKTMEEIAENAPKVLGPVVEALSSACLEKETPEAAISNDEQIPDKKGSSSEKAKKARSTKQ
jgi:hypothetical protein